jgi:hypothetical protein
MTDEMREAQTFPLLSPSDLSLDLDRQKRHAKDLRNAVREGCKNAIARLQRHHPRFTELNLDLVKLTDAQLTVAREAGLSSWPALKKHVSQIEAARSAIESKQDAPDSDMPTLHIRCGNDIEQALKRAGFAGDFLVFVDPICQGPVSSGEQAHEVRAEFIAAEYQGQAFEDNLKDLDEAEIRLSEAGTYARIALWFEHDPYDQLLLAKVLARLKENGADQRKVELISLDKFPGISKFIGIGQLSPAALRHMFNQRRQVDCAAYPFASDVWKALGAPTPLPLFELASPSRALPYMRGSILRYLAELPSVTNGLSFTEQTALEIVKNGPLPWGKVFRTFMMDHDPLPFHGDLMFLGTLIRLRDAGNPALSSEAVGKAPEQWGTSRFSLTQVGHELLAGCRDWKDCAPRHRSNGGVTCFAEPDWRWDERLQTPVAIARTSTGNR